MTLVDGAVVIGFIFFLYMFISLSSDMAKAEKKKKQEEKANKHPLAKGILGGILTYKAMEVLNRSNSDQTGKTHRVEDEL